MPYLGDVFLNTVYEETPARSVKTTDHAVEDLGSIVDHVKKDPMTLSISGVITGSDAGMKYQKLIKYNQEGEPVKYRYRNSVSNVIIKDLSTTHDSSVLGGFKFSILLKQITVAKPSLITVLKRPQKVQVATIANKGLQQTRETTKTRTHTVESGETLSEISQQYYGTTTKYMVIANASNISNPDVINAGQVLTIP